MYLGVGEAGQVVQRRGLVDPAWEAEQRAKAEARRERERAEAADDEGDAATAGGNGVTAQGSTADAGGKGEAGVSRTLALRLTRARTEALRAAMARDPQAAADLLLAHLAERVFFRVQFAARPPLPFDVAIEPGLNDWCPGTGRSEPARGSHGTDAASEAQRAFYDAAQAWRSRLPQTPDALPAFVAGLDPLEKLNLLGLLAAAGVNAVMNAADNSVNARQDEAAARAAEHVGCDVTAWWRPTAAEFFGHLTKAGIAAAVAEALPGDPAKAEAVATMKKGDAARRAEQLVSGTNWLPAPVRPAHRPRQAEERQDADPLRLPPPAEAVAAPAKQAA